MLPNQSPFATGWWSFDLPHRGCASTYCLFSYEDLPPIHRAFTGDFAWLSALSENMDNTMQLYRRPDEQAKMDAQLAENQATLATHGLSFPPEFNRFMQSPTLQDAIPSVTACYFTLSPLTPSPFDDGGHFVRFLNDQQDCIFWYLYLAPDKGHYVVASPVMLDESLQQAFPAEHLPAIQASVKFCGETFEAFIYRWWLENHLWLATEEGEDSNLDAQFYLDHYQNLKPLS